MSKRVSLKNKQSAAKPEKEQFYLFVKDQGEGGARIAVIVLKIVQIMITTIFALCLGIFGPLTLMLWMDDPDIAAMPAARFWLVASILYIIGTFVIMLGHSKVACGIHAIAAVFTFVTFYNYVIEFSEVPDNNGPTLLYMPCLFILIISVIIMMLINIPKWMDAYTKKTNAKAPSILGDDD